MTKMVWIFKNKIEKWVSANHFFVIFFVYS